MLKPELKKKLVKVQTIVALVSFVYILARFFLSSPRFFAIEFSFVMEIALLTLLTRSMILQEMRSALSLGILLGIGITLLVGKGIFGSILHVSSTSSFFSALVTPLLEEACKLLPVALIAWLTWRNRKVLPSPSDMVMLAVISGAAFGMMEKLFWKNVMVSNAYGPYLFGLPLFPDALGAQIDRSGAVIGYIGHAAASGLITMAVMMGLALRESRVSRVRKVWWTLPLFVTGWVMVEHGLLNLYFASHSRALLLLGGGHVTPWLFILLFLAMIAFELWNVRETYRRSSIMQALVWSLRRKINAPGPRPFSWYLGCYRAVISLLRYMNRVSWYRWLRKSVKEDAKVNKAQQESPEPAIL